LLHHAGHTEYIGRHSGNAHCPQSFRLYDLSNLGLTESDLAYGDGAIMMWEGGRWNGWREAELRQAIEHYIHNGRKK
jgi:hypothetical protein